MPRRKPIKLLCRHDYKTRKVHYHNKVFELSVCSKCLKSKMKDLGEFHTITKVGGT